MQQHDEHPALPYGGEILFEECDPRTGRPLTAEELAEAEAVRQQLTAAAVAAMHRLGR